MRGLCAVVVEEQPIIRNSPFGRESVPVIKYR